MTFRNATALLIATALAAPAQDPVVSMFPVPKFPEGTFFRQYIKQELPKVDLEAPARLAEFVIGDHLELSLRSYLELVLANNTDIQVQRVTLETFKPDLLRTFGRFDPILASTFNATRSNQATASLLEGTSALSTLNQPFTGNVTQVLENGSSYRVGFSASKFTTNNAFATLNPQINSGLQIGYTQPLLQNRGKFVNRIPLMLAKSRLRQAEHSMKDQLLGLIQRAENAYWQVIQDREFLKVQEEALRVAGEFLKRNTRELELGAISALEIYQPQQQYANSEIAVTQARYRLQQSEDQLRRQIAADLDPQFRNLPIVLTESTLPPTDDAPLDKEKYVEAAYLNRPDLKAQLQNLDLDDLQYRQIKNQLMPQLDLNFAYNSNGLSGNQLPRTINLGTGVPTVTKLIPGGIGGALNQVFGFDFPTYVGGLTLRLPLRDRTRQADLADNLIQKRLDTLRARAIEQTIRQDTLNAVTQVESARASVKLNQTSLNFSNLRLDAETKRYDLGVSTIFFVIQAQQDKSRAEGDLVTASVQYRRALLTLLRVTGTLLEERGVVVQ
ncbi:MAG: TolC family protein [Bryobacteraceae bacterium]